MSKTISLLELPEEPDFLDEQSEWASLEAAALDVDLAYSNIKANGGVSRGIVEPVLHLLPNTVNPLSFTVNPSQTNLTVTLEALDVKQMLLLGAAVVAVGLLLAKIINMLVNTADTVEANTTRASKSAQAMKATATKLDKVERITSPDLQREYEARRPDHVDPRYARMAEMWNPLLKDIMDNGPVTRTLVSANKHFMKISEYIVATVRVIKEYSAKSINGNDLEIAKALTSIDAVCFPSYSPETRNALAAIHRCKGEGVSTIEDVREVYDAFRTMGEASLAVGFNGERALKEALSVKVGAAPIDDLNLSGNLRRLDRSIDKLEKSKINKAVGAEVEKALRHATSTLRQALETLRIYVNMTARIVSMRNSYIDECNLAVGAKLKCRVQAIVTVGTDTDKEELRKISFKE